MKNQCFHFQKKNKENEESGVETPNTSLSVSNRHPAVGASAG
jgi:hypothetical protein